MLRRTKIIATLGPATDREGVLEAIGRAGLNVARLNFSHGSHDEHAGRIRAVRRLERELGRPVGILQDLQGPKLRIGTFAEGSVTIVSGDTFLLSSLPVEGSRSEVYVDIPGLLQDVKPGDTILLKDGLIQLQAEAVTAESVLCRVIDGGELTSRSGIHLPVSSGHLRSLTEKDLADLDFGIRQGVDMIALSFVRTAEDVKHARAHIRAAGADIPIIAKIEKKEALDNFDDILKEADGIMVARGDLGIESDITKVPIAQKCIIAKCNLAGKPVITATQMLESMVRNLQPTRAEVTDVANAVFDGTDAVMLSGETAIGDYPLECVSMMHKIALSAEKARDHRLMGLKNTEQSVDSVTEAIGEATAAIAADLHVPAIITFTSSGWTARMVSKFRPEAIVVAVTSMEATLRRLTLSWGVFPLLADEMKSTDEMIANAVARALEAGFVARGDIVVVTAGVPIGVSGATNLIKVHCV